LTLVGIIRNSQRLDVSLKFELKLVSVNDLLFNTIKQICNFVYLSTVHGRNMDGCNLYSRGLGLHIFHVSHPVWSQAKLHHSMHMAYTTD